MVAGTKESSTLERQAHLKWQWHLESSKSALSDTLSPTDRTS